ncbi:MAG: endonuclease III [Clostridia bacterium]|nr:endonuclease III [Clostridia bacterium]
MTKKERAAEIQKVFDVVYADAVCSLDYTTEHELLVAVQLSAQCTDARVNLVTPALFNRYKSVEDFAEADLEELKGYIKSCGFYHNKAKNIIESSKQIIQRHGGKLPNTMEELTALAGVGRKTANLILGDVFSLPSIVVDTHCIRLTNRFGLVSEKDPVKIETALRKILNPESSGRFCHQIVYHGRAVCTARKPKCDECPVKHLCKSCNKC